MCTSRVLNHVFRGFITRSTSRVLELLGVKYTKTSVVFAGKRLSFLLPLWSVNEALVNMEHVLVDCDYFRVSWAIPRGPSIVVDAGAFLGFYSVASSILTGREGVVYALEPNKHILPYLHANIGLNRAVNTKILPIALCPESGLQRLYLGYHPATTSILPEHVEYHGGIAGYLIVKCTRLSSILEYLGRVDILKLDIEGLERDVLREARNQLSRVKTIVVEIHLDVTDPRDIERVLSSVGFNKLVTYSSSEMPTQLVIYASR